MAEGFVKRGAGEKSPAGVLGVSPNSFFFPHEWGIQGVDTQGYPDDNNARAYIKEIDERFYYGVDDIKAMVANKQRIDTSIYHDSAKIMAESINNTIDKLDNVRKSLPNLQRPSK